MSKALGAFGKTFGWIGIALTVISLFVSLRQQKKLQGKKQSYTYGDGALTTQISTTAPVPIIYGTVKTAGNMIYSRLSSDKKTIYKLIALSDGKIKEIRDLKFDDKAWNSSDFDSPSKDFYLGDGVQEIDGRVEGDTQELKAQKVGGLRHTAYVALQVKANENLSGSFNVTCLVDGVLVKKYKNANNLSDYVEEWSDNPAWCVLDFMTRYNGCGMSLDEIDVQSFIDGAKFFDEKKYTLNLILDEQRSRLEWVQYMLNCCRSLLVYRAGKYSLFVEKADEVVQRYTSNDIHDLNIWFSPLQEVPDIYRVTYIDPENEWVKINAEASLSADSYLRKQPLVETIELMGVTNFDQASRLAWFYLNQALTCQTYVEFQTDRRALNRTVGDVIELTDYVTEFQNKKFRIIKIEDTQDGSIKLTCREYNGELYSEQRGATAPVINITTLADPQASPPEVVYIDNRQEYYILPDKTKVSIIRLDVSYDDFVYNKGFDVWYQEVGTDLWQYGGFFEDGSYTALIKNIDIQKSYIFRFQSVSKFGKVSRYSYSPEIYITGRNNPPDMPQNFRASEVMGGFNFSWDAGEIDVDYYELYEGSVAPENLQAKIYGNTYNYSALVGDYAFYLVAVDTVGNRSTPALLELTIDRPDDVSGFDCFQNGRNIEFHWNKVEGASYYVLKEGSNWEFGNTLATISGAFFSYPYAQATSTQFWLKAYTEYGVSSLYPSYTQITVAPIPNRNLLKVYDAGAEDWKGQLYNMHLNAGGIQLDTGKVYGEYLYEIDLEQDYCARNWVEKTVIPVDEDSETKWKDAKFTWKSPEAKRRTWFPMGKDDLFNSMTEIAIYNEDSTDEIIDRISLNGSLTSDSNITPSNVGTPIYSDIRVQKGLMFDDACKPKWNNLDLNERFSLNFSLYAPYTIAEDYSLLTLRNDDGDYLHLHFRASDGNFVISLSDGFEMTLDDFSKKEDYLHFMLSQGDGYLTFVIHSLFYDAYLVNRGRISKAVKYNQMALYKDLGGV